MSALANPSQGLDLTGGVDLATVPEGGILLGHVGDEAMSEAEAREVLARQRGLGEWSIEYFLARESAACAASRDSPGASNPRFWAG